MSLQSLFWEWYPISGWYYIYPVEVVGTLSTVKVLCRAGKQISYNGGVSCLDEYKCPNGILSKTRI